MVTTQTVVWVNKKFSTGSLINKNSLDYAIKTESSKIFGNLPYIIRALLVDHCFEDGNKRTAAFLLVNFCEENRIEVNQEKIIKTTINISRSNPKNIEKIRSMMKYALT